jgi:hypothetical protein
MAHARAIGRALSWGICTTVKAPLDQILAFVAWHTALGAERIWVHLDDADPVTAHVLNQLDNVTAVLCDDAYWAVKGGRPRQQEVRQGYNVQRIYNEGALPFLAHIDVDEFLWPNREMADILRDWPEDQPFIRAVPAEALHDPALADDISTANRFRLPFAHEQTEADKVAVLGAYAPLLPRNMLSHHAGKSIFKTGIEGLLPRIHAASLGAERKPPQVPLHPDLKVLHFHAQDRAGWTAAVPQRVVTGAYRYNESLAAFLQGATAAQIDAFYDATQVATPAMLAELERLGLLVRADLGLRDKINDLSF